MEAIVTHETEATAVAESPARKDDVWTLGAFGVLAAACRSKEKQPPLWRFRSCRWYASPWPYVWSLGPGVTLHFAR
jgi:hypothetical protein